MGNISWFQFGISLAVATCIYYSYFYYHYYVKCKDSSKGGSLQQQRFDHTNHDILGGLSNDNKILAPIGQIPIQHPDNYKQPVLVTAPNAAHVSQNEIENVNEDGIEEGWRDDMDLDEYKTVEVIEGSVIDEKIEASESGTIYPDGIVLEDEIAFQEKLKNPEEIDTKALLVELENKTADDFGRKMIERLPGAIDLLQTYFFKLPEAGQNNYQMKFPRLSGVIGVARSEENQLEAVGDNDFENL